MSSNNNNQSFQNLSQLNSSQDAGQKSYFQYSLIRLKENGQLARTYNQEVVQKQIGMSKYKMGDYMQMFTNTKEQYKEINENEDLQQSFKGRYSFSSQKQPPQQNQDSAKKVSPSHSKKQTTRDATYPCYFEQIDGVYEGDVDLNYKKEGLGMFIADSGEAYIGEWTNDQMHGEGILHFPFGGYIYGQFKQGRVQGIGILQLPQNQIYIGYWKQSRLNGKCFELNLAKKTWLMSEYANGQLINRLASEPAEITQSSGLAGPKFMEPYEDIRFWMQRLSKKMYFAEREVNFNQKHLRYMNIEKGLDYIGFLENKKTPNGLGLVSFEKRIISGNFKSGVLDGSGRMILENGDIYDGYFKGGRFQGVGVYFNFERNTYLHAIFDENKPQQVIAKGVGYPSNVIVKIKSENHRFHKRYYQKESHFERISVLADFSRQVYLDYQEMYSSNQQDQQERFYFPETYEPHNPDPLIQLQVQQQQSTNLGQSTQQQQQQQQNTLQSPSSPEKTNLLQNGSIKNTKPKSHFLERLTDSPFSLTLQEMLANKQKQDSTSAEASNTSPAAPQGQLVKQNSNNNIFAAKTSVIGNINNNNNNSQNNPNNSNNSQNNPQTQSSQLVPPNSTSNQPQGQATQQNPSSGFTLQRSQTQESNSSRPGTANLNPTSIPNNINTQNNNSAQNNNNNNTNLINTTFQNNSMINNTNNNNKSNNNSSNNSGNSSLINPSSLNQQIKQRENNNSIISPLQQFSTTLQQKLAQQQQNYPENIIDSPVKQNLQEIRTNMGIQGFNGCINGQPRKPINQGIGVPYFAMNKVPMNNNNTIYNPGMYIIDNNQNYQQSLQYPYQNSPQNINYMKEFSPMNQQYSIQDNTRSFTPNERFNNNNQFPLQTNSSSFFTPQQSLLFQQRLQEMKPYPRRQRIFQDSPPRSNKGSPQRSFRPDKNSIDKSLKNNIQDDIDQGQGQNSDGIDNNNLSHSQHSQNSSQRLVRNDTARSTLSQQRARKSALLSEINPSSEKQNLTLQSGILVTPEDPNRQSKSQDNNNSQWFFNPQNQQLTLQPQANSKLNFSDLTQARQDHFGGNNQYRAELSAGARVKLRSIITEESKQSQEWKKDKNKKNSNEDIAQGSQYNKQGQRIDSVKNFSFSPDSKQRESMLLLGENDRTNSELTLRISVAGSEKQTEIPKRAIFHPIPLQNFEEDRSESKFFRNEYRLQQQKELQLQVKRSKRSRKNILEPLVAQQKGFELLGSEYRDVVSDNNNNKSMEKKQPTGRMSSQLKDSLLNLQTYDAALNFKETAMNQQYSNYSPSSSYILTNRGNNMSQFMQSTGFDRQIGQQSQSMSPQGSEMTQDYNNNNKQMNQVQLLRASTNFRQGKQSVSLQQNQQNISEIDDNRDKQDIITNSSKLKGNRQSQQQGFSQGNPQGMFVSFDNKNAK